MKMSDRRFGVEIELIGLSIEQASRLLRKSKITADWEAKGDCSVSDHESGQATCEVVSPILQGSKGLAVLHKVVTMLRKNGAWANKTCGLHVHVDAADLTTAWARNIFDRYRKHEYVIESFMPVDRVSSPFALPMDTLGRDYPEMLEEQSLGWTLTRFCSRPGSRYYRVNFLSYLRHGSIEFRQHSGSVNAEAIENWVRFVIGFVEACNPSKPTAEKAAKAPRKAPRVPGRGRGRPAGARKYRAAKALLSMLMDSDYLGGTTASMLVRRLGCAPSSIPQIISYIRSEFGIPVWNVAAPADSTDRARRYLIKRGELNWSQCDTIGNLRRYVEHTTNERNSQELRIAAEAARAVVEDHVFLGIPSDVVAFYRERTMEMGHARRPAPLAQAAASGSYASEVRGFASPNDNSMPY